MRRMRPHAHRLGGFVRAISRRDLWEVPLADKKAAKLARRENKEARAREKAERDGASPAQEAEAVRRREAENVEDTERRTGLDGSVGGDTATDRPGS
jgi:hypothetical protein